MYQTETLNIDLVYSRFLKIFGFLFELLFLSWELKFNTVNQLSLYVKKYKKFVCYVLDKLNQPTLMAIINDPQNKTKTAWNIMKRETSDGNSCRNIDKVVVRGKNITDPL